MDPAKEVSPIDRLKGWVDEFGSAKNLVIVLEGETHLERKPVRSANDGLRRTS